MRGVPSYIKKMIVKKQREVKKKENMKLLGVDRAAALLIKDQKLEIERLTGLLLEKK